MQPLPPSLIHTVDKGNSPALSLADAELNAYHRVSRIRNFPFLPSPFSASAGTDAAHRPAAAPPAPHDSQDLYEMRG